MHKTRAAVLILFLASTLAFGGCLAHCCQPKNRYLFWVGSHGLVRGLASVAALK